MVENKCYDPDCNEEECFNPEHYNYICFDPDCKDEKCMNEKHYNKQLLKDYQKSTDLSAFDHREEIDYDEDVDIIGGHGLLKLVTVNGISIGSNGYSDEITFSINNDLNLNNDIQDLIDNYEFIYSK